MDKNIVFLIVHLYPLLSHPSRQISHLYLALTLHLFDLDRNSGVGVRFLSSTPLLLSPSPFPFPSPLLIPLPPSFPVQELLMREEIGIVETARRLCASKISHAKVLPYSLLPLLPTSSFLFSLYPLPFPLLLLSLPFPSFRCSSLLLLFFALTSHSSLLSLYLPPPPLLITPSLPLSPLSLFLFLLSS